MAPVVSALRNAMRTRLTVDPVRGEYWLTNGFPSGWKAQNCRDLHDVRRFCWLSLSEEERLKYYVVWNDELDDLGYADCKKYNKALGVAFSRDRKFIVREVNNLRPKGEASASNWHGHLKEKYSSDHQRARRNRNDRTNWKASPPNGKLYVENQRLLLVERRNHDKWPQISTQLSDDDMGTLANNLMTKSSSFLPGMRSPLQMLQSVSFGQVFLTAKTHADKVWMESIALLVQTSRYKGEEQGPPLMRNKTGTRIDCVLQRPDVERLGDSLGYLTPDDTAKWNYIVLAEIDLESDDIVKALIEKEEAQGHSHKDSVLRVSRPAYAVEQACQRVAMDDDVASYHILNRCAGAGSWNNGGPGRYIIGFLYGPNDLKTRMGNEFVRVAGLIDTRPVHLRLTKRP
jgi:hypothetical protein